MQLRVSLLATLATFWHVVLPEYAEKGDKPDLINLDSLGPEVIYHFAASEWTFRRKC